MSLQGQLYSMLGNAQSIEKEFPAPPRACGRGGVTGLQESTARLKQQAGELQALALPLRRAGTSKENVRSVQPGTLSV